MSKANRIFTELESKIIRESVALCDKSPSGLIWLINGRRMKKGDHALCVVGSNGYQSGSISGIRLTAHRIVYFLSRGYWNKGRIDHVDGNKLNNNPDNLRDVDYALNATNNKSKGVYITANGNWQAQVTHKGKVYNQTFCNYDQAVAWRKEKKKELNPEIKSWQFD